MRETKRRETQCGRSPTRPSATRVCAHLASIHLSPWWHSILTHITTSSSHPHPISLLPPTSERFRKYPHYTGGKSSWWQISHWTLFLFPFILPSSYSCGSPSSQGFIFHQRVPIFTSIPHPEYLFNTINFRICHSLWESIYSGRGG